MATRNAKRGYGGGFSGASGAGFAAQGQRQTGFAAEVSRSKSSRRPRRSELGSNDTPATLPRIDLGRRLAGGSQGNEWRRFARDFAQHNKRTELLVPESQLILLFMASDKAEAMFRRRLDIPEKPTKNDTRNLDTLILAINKRVGQMCTQEAVRIEDLHSEDPDLKERIIDPHNPDLIFRAEDHGELIRRHETTWRQDTFEAIRLGASAQNAVSVLIGGEKASLLSKGRDDFFNILSDDFNMPVSGFADEAWQPSLNILIARSGRPVGIVHQPGPMPIDMTLKEPHAYTIK